MEDSLLNDSEYDNELLCGIASQSPRFTQLVESGIQGLSQGQGHEVIWLGSLSNEVSAHTQVQLVITQSPFFKVDES